jgi:hypothetical protein
VLSRDVDEGLSCADVVAAVCADARAARLRCSPARPVRLRQARLLAGLHETLALAITAGLVELLAPLDAGAAPTGARAAILDPPPLLCDDDDAAPDLHMD